MQVVMQLLCSTLNRLSCMCSVTNCILTVLQKACEELPSLEKDIAAGQFKPLRDWLKEKIHKVGSLHANGDELMVAVTGAPLDPSVFLKYLRTKYTELYKL